ncbi:MAG: hypothetical protein J6A45_00280 [Lachnospiraceae bacterium]|nr:hypothetical protein [Lachnospiraceae bacterium]
MMERFELAAQRIKECTKEHFSVDAYDRYFKEVTDFLQIVCRQYMQLAEGELDVAKVPLAELQSANKALYAQVLPERYETSFLNPAFAVRELGEEYGRLLSCLYTQLRSTIGYAYEQKLELFTVRLELFLEVYGAFVYEMEESGKLPVYESIRQIVYWFISDYSDIETLDRVKGQVCLQENLYVDIIMHSDLKDLRYLYRYGVYISDNELRIAAFLNAQPEDKIKLMAHTYIEGYRKGFEMAGKDLSKKKTAMLYYHVGFERMLREAVKELRALGLEPTVMRERVEGAPANRQYPFDHRDDLGLFWDKQLLQRKIDVLKNAFEELKKEAAGQAGPAVVEVFGETPFAPVNKPECVSMDEEARKLFVEYRSQSGEITNQYIKGE